MGALNVKHGNIDEIYLGSIEEIADHADVVCQNACQNIAFLKDQFDNEIPSKKNFDVWNITAIGNFAYLALHAPEPYKTKYTQELNEYIKWRKNGGHPSDRFMEEEKLINEYLSK